MKRFTIVGVFAFANLFEKDIVRVRFTQRSFIINLSFVDLHKGIMTVVFFMYKHFYSFAEQTKICELMCKINQLSLHAEWRVDQTDRAMMQVPTRLSMVTQIAIW